MVRGRIRSQLQYPLGFALDVAGTCLIAALDLVAIVVLFANVDVMVGWSALQICVLFGIAQLSFAVAELAVGHLDRLPIELRAGTFDGVLVKPRSSLLLIVASDFTLRRVGQVALAFCVLVLSWSRVGPRLDPYVIALTLLTVATGTAIFCGIWVIGAATTFWTVDTMEITNAFTYGGRQLSTFPIGIYSQWVRRLVLFVVPLGCVAYFPVRYLVGLEPRNASSLVRFVGVPAAIAVGTVAGFVWRAAVRTYRGTGS
jgi:ABC-2 type transport system permease protein